MMFFNFQNFFAFIFEFSNSGRIRTDRKEIFFVLYFSACLHPFRLEMKPGWCFLIFRIFLHLFLNFLTRVVYERIGRKLFLFTIFRPVLDLFRLELKPGWCFFIFKIFWQLFLNFLTRVWFERIEGNFFCSLFFGRSWPVSSCTEAWMTFFNF